MSDVIAGGSVDVATATLPARRDVVTEVFVHHLDRGWLLMLQMDETGHADEHRVVT